ncbi:MAG: hypothetical protein FRX49_10028 [Trebouxia sp. A1-2]|nr:MAG: hypothetical protein FRX49_10028 [Trebouxia sp. A1-2]
MEKSSVLQPPLQERWAEELRAAGLLKGQHRLSASPLSAFRRASDSASGSRAMGSFLRSVKACFSASSFAKI